MIFQHVSLFFVLFFVNFISLSKAQTDQCTGVSCNNKGTCVPNAVYSRGYWCECDDGWAGQDCKHPEPTVQCGDDQIDVVIDKGLVQELEIDDDVKYVYFGRSTANRQCRAVEQGNLYKLSIRAPFSNCGTQVTQHRPGDDYTFSNTVVWNREVNNQQNLIDRELVLLDFKCIYEDTYTVSGPPILPSLNVLKFATEQGKFEVRMRLFDDSSYAPANEYTQAPTIAIGTYVYVQVDLAFSRDSSLVVTMDRCFASQSSDPADPISTKHLLIIDRCATPNDTTVEVRYNGERTEAQFKFQMFKWRWSADDVYLHCEVDICNKTKEMCTGEGINCKGMADFRRKRSTLTHEGVYDSNYVPHPGHTLTQGPIQVYFDDIPASEKATTDGDKQSVDFTLVALALFCSLVLVMLGVIAAVVIRKRHMRKKAKSSASQQQQQPSNTNQRLTSLRFSTESF